MSISSRLREQVRIEQPSLVEDEYGGRLVTWGEFATVFAEVTAMLGAVSEQEIGEQRAARAGYRVTIRNRGDVMASMRVIWKNHILQVQSKHEAEGLLHLFTYEEIL